MNSATDFLAAILETAAIAVLAPLIPGTIQWLKAYMQGRLGQPPWQPYRELRRLWNKSCVRPSTSSLIYGSAPAVVAACQLTAILLLVPPGTGTYGPIGNDMLVLVGVLTLGRFVLALSAFDTSSGFGLMAASRELMLSVWAEVALLLALLLEALPARSTSLLAMERATAGAAVWASPAHYCALVALALVILTETGRQPVDNPDTHLELTMIHEGPLLEYAGPDLAYLQWAAAARHALLLVMAGAIFLPHLGQSTADLAASTLLWVLVIIVALAITETFFAKMRLLRVPNMLATGSLVAILGSISWFTTVGK